MYQECKAGPCKCEICSRHEIINRHFLAHLATIEKNQQRMLFMADQLSIYLSESTAPEEWGSNCLYTSSGSDITIHLSGNDDLATIQKSGRQLCQTGIEVPILSGQLWDVERQWAFAKGFYSAKRRNAPVWADGDQADVAELQNRFIAADWVRTQMNATPEALSPEKLIKSAAHFIHSASTDISYEYIVGEELANQGYEGTYQVGRGSVRPPAVLKLDYNPTGDPDAPIAAALVGKGITFDSGGYSLKTSQGMVAMKMDMGGAAYVTGALWLAIKRGLKSRVVLYLCCAENLVSGHAYKLGDILQYPNGTSVEIVNTDAEGRLVLADGLLKATESGAPLIIDAATLTGAAHVAVGNEYNAIFTMDDALRACTLAAAEQESEPHWALPLEKFHRYKCPSDYADTANSVAVKGGGAGGASNAAGFLSRFVSDDAQGWLHIDLAGAMFSKDNALWSAGGSAMGIRTIARLLTDCD